MRQVKINLKLFVELYQKGFTDEMIAQKLGISRATVIRKRRELGLRPNRKRGERGPGKVSEDKSYYVEVVRLMRHVGKEIFSAATRYLASTGDESKAWAATVIDPGNIPHPAPGPHAVKVEKINLTTAKFICEYERRADMANMAGVPGPAIIELARVYKTVDEETKKELAMKAVLEAGFVRVCETVKEVVKRGTEKISEWKQIWSERIKKACEWAPVKKEAPRIWAFYGAACESIRTGTGQLGRGGGIRNIEVRRALLGAAGY